MIETPPLPHAVERGAQQWNAGGLVFISPWLDDEPAKHNIFRCVALHALETKFPWLARLLEQEGAYVLAGVRAFYIATQAHPRDWVEINELSQCLSLTPWPEDGETAH